MKLLKLLLLFTLLFSPLSAFAKDSIYMIIDSFEKPSDPVAVNILYNYVLSEYKDIPVFYNKLKKSGRAAVSAYRVDLNYDGIDEVIGIHKGTLYCGTGGCGIFILQKTKNGGYKDISNLPAYVRGNMIKIFNNKRNGYRALWIIHPVGKKFSKPALFTGERYKVIFD